MLCVGLILGEDKVSQHCDDDDKDDNEHNLAHGPTLLHHISDLLCRRLHPRTQRVDLPLHIIEESFVLQVGVVDS